MAADTESLALRESQLLVSVTESGADGVLAEEQALFTRLVNDPHSLLADVVSGGTGGGGFALGGAPSTQGGW